ncbi:MAG: EAL domain-containing protein [Zoogloeaceae bacterium]|jgi:diguanylate cyclase (GGDEF)-like protein/PAS domain S-box-containing protein|nr:EAL domain-containing protein [Zoogloeaceae bacterium]
MKLRSSLRLRLFLVLLLAFFLAMSFQVTNNVRLVKAELSAQLETRILSLEHAYHTTLAGMLFSRDYATLRDTLEGWHATGDIVFMQVLDPAGKELAAAGKSEFSVGPGIREAVFPIVLEGQAYGTVRFGVSTAFIDQAQNELIVQHVLITLVSFFLLTLALFAIGYYFTRGLARLEEAAAQIGKGNFSYRVPISGADELARLGEAFNTMFGAVEHQVEALKASEQRFRAIADYTYAWENWFAPDGRLLWVNPAVQRMVGFTPEECLAMPEFPLPLVHEDDKDIVRYQGRIARDGLSGQDLEIRFLRRDGHVVWTAMSWQPIHDDEGKSLGYRSSIRDTTQQHYATEELAYQAIHDALTGLFNRRAFERRLQQIFGHSEGSHEENLPLSVLYVDLDQFKVVNDTCGHEAGDQLLIDIVKVLKAQVGPGFLARLGGDEFGIILRCAEAEALALARKLVHEIHASDFNYQGRSFRPGVSIGIAQAAGGIGSVSELMMAADTACYAAKERGRNRVEVYSRADEYFRLRHEDFRSVERVTEALSQGRFLLYHQRIEALRRGGARHTEILIRLRDDHGNILAPQHFITAAERFNLMAYIDAWVVENVCRQLAEWDTREFQPDLHYFCVNLSEASLSDPDFPEFILAQINQYDIDPGRLCFEIAEGCAVKFMQETRRFIRKMHEIGVALALDDFGTGPSSFLHLKEFHVDFLKIDETFVKSLTQEPRNKAIIAAMLQLARAYDLVSVAEFVCDAATLETVRKMGVEYAQGYALHQPEPLLALEVPQTASAEPLPSAKADKFQQPHKDEAGEIAVRRTQDSGR